MQLVQSPFHYILTFIAGLSLATFSFGQQSLKDSLEQRLTVELNNKDRVNTLCDLAWEVANSNNQQAVEYSDQAMALAIKIRYEEGRASTYTTMGYIADATKDSKKTISNYNAALTIYLKIERYDKAGTSYSNMAVIHQETGNYEKALSNYKNAREMHVKSKDKDREARALAGIGDIYFYKGDYAVAIDHYSQALKIQEKEGFNYASSVTLNNIGNVYFNQEDLDQALRYYKRAVKIKEDMGETSSLGSGYNNMAAIYFSQNKLKLAKKYFEKALTIRKANKDQVGISECLNNLAHIHKREGRYQQALNFYKEALEIKKLNGNLQSSALSMNNLALVYLELNQLGEAEKYGLKCLEIAEEIKAKDDIKHALSCLSEIYAAKGNYKTAYDYFLRYTNLKDELYSIEKAEEIAKISAIYQVEKSQREVAEKKTIIAENAVELEQQASEIDRKTVQRNAIIVFFGLLALIVFILWRNRLKRRKTNEEMAKQHILSYIQEIELLKTNQKLKKFSPDKDLDNTIEGELNNYLLNPLTERELEVLSSICNGLTNKDISEKLFVSINTIKTHNLRIYEKLNVKNRTQAMVKASDFEILSTKK